MGSPRRHRSSPTDRSPLSWAGTRSAGRMPIVTRIPWPQLSRWHGPRATPAGGMSKFDTSRGSKQATQLTTSIAGPSPPPGPRQQATRRGGWLSGSGHRGVESGHDLIETPIHHYRDPGHTMVRDFEFFGFLFPCTGHCGRLSEATVPRMLILDFPNPADYARATSRISPCVADWNAQFRSLRRRRM